MSIARFDKHRIATAKLIHALKPSKVIVRNMKQNQFLAVGTVVLLLAGVISKNVNLASGMLIHELSVLFVILNAIRLVKYKSFPSNNHTTRKIEKKSFSTRKVCVEC